MSADLSAVRRRAWETRRAKYGKSGHGGSYRTSPLRQSEAMFKAELARQNISQARRQCQIMLPAQAAHVAITRLDIADDLLTEAFMPTFSAAQGIETAQPPRREAGLARKGESPVAAKRCAQPPSSKPPKE